MMCEKVCLCCLPILQQMVQTLDDRHIPPFTQIGVVWKCISPVTMAEVKCFSASVDTVELHMSSPFSFKVKRPHCLANTLAYMGDLLLFITSGKLFVSSCGKFAPCCTRALCHDCSDFCCGLKPLGGPFVQCVLVLSEKLTG